MFKNVLITANTYKYVICGNENKVILLKLKKKKKPTKLQGALGKYFPWKSSGNVLVYII